EYSTGNNLLSGGDGNDSLSISGYAISYASGQNLFPSSGNNTLNGGAGDDTLNATISTGNNLLSGGDGNDSFYVSTASPDIVPSYLVTQTVDGGKGDDFLSVDYSYVTGGITSTFNPTTNIGAITAGTNRVSYKNIEQLNISGTRYDDNIVGSSGNDTLSVGTSGKDTVDGGKGDDVLSVDYTYTNTGVGITTTFNATTNIGEITAGTNRVSYKNIERLNISGTAYDDNIVGNSGNDTLFGGYGNDTIIGGAGNDILTGGDGTNILTGGAGNDEFVYNFLDSSFDTGTDIITDFGGIGKGSNPSASVIASLDTLQFIGSGLTAQNLQLTQNGNNLEITFENVANNKVILQNFKLENLDNLPATSSRPAIGNILFDGQTSITDSFDVFDANSTQTSLFNRNTVTFLNDLDNNITGFDNSNDIINGQEGDDIIDGLSGNDLLRGDAGNDTLIGGAGNDTLIGGAGNNTLDGGIGDDSLSAGSST
ncbi:MAG: calcium-binding protein, partial [Nostoc sp.]